MEIPKDIEKWLIYDENKLEYVFKPDTPKEIKERYYKYLEETSDFELIIDDIE